MNQVSSPVIICQRDSSSNHLFLTFDDGPDPRFTPAILDILEQAGMVATFFVVGSAAVCHPQLIRRMVAQGHEVANHTWSHRHPWTLPESVARREVTGASQALADLLGRAPRYFRPPHGRLRRCMLEETAALGQTVVLWTLSGVDWGPWGRAAWISRRLDGARGRDIVLLHDGRRRHNRPGETIQVLGGFLSKLRQRCLRSALLDGSQAWNG